MLGSICRYHETSSGVTDEDSDDDENDASEELTWSNLTALCERLFTDFLAKSDPQTKCAALRGLCGVFIAHPREMLRMNESGLISEVMSPDSPPSVQLESLICWRDILLVSPFSQHDLASEINFI